MRICHISEHPRIECPCGCGGCECIHRYDNYEMPKTVLVGVVPGGANDTEAYRFHKDFDKGLYAYEKAKKDGLQPEGTSLEAVERTKRKVASQERGLKKLRAMGAIENIDSVKTLKGVEV